MKQAEFLTVVMPFKDKLYRMAKRLLVSKEEAEDVTQEILMRLWSKKNGMQRYSSTEAFAMTMTKNLCLDRLKSKQAQHITLAHSNYDVPSEALETQMEVADSVAWVQRIMDTLPAQQKIILQLRDVEQYSFEEIEAIVAMKPTAIRVALSRARKTVKQQLIEKHRHGIG